jgi:hypothetical protein
MLYKKTYMHYYEHMNLNISSLRIFIAKTFTGERFREIYRFYIQYAFLYLLHILR